MAIDGLGGPRGYDRADRLDQGSSSQDNQAERSEGRDGDRIEVSGKARQISELVDQARSLPEIRQDRVDEIRRALANGSYKFDARQLAGAILEFEDGIGN